MFLSFLRARINEGHFGIETIHFYESNWIRFDMVETHNTNLRPIEKPRITYQVRIVNVFPIGITEDLTQHPADNHD